MADSMLRHAPAIAAVVDAKAARAAAELRLNETILAAVESGHSYGELSKATGFARGWLHTRARRAEGLRPHGR